MIMDKLKIYKWVKIMESTYNFEINKHTHGETIVLDKLVIISKIIFLTKKLIKNLKQS